MFSETAFGQKTYDGGDYGSGGGKHNKCRSENYNQEEI